MLLRADRVAEAIEVLTVLDSGHVLRLGLRALCSGLVARGRHGDALALIEEVAGQAGGMSLEMLKLRANALAARGDLDQAIAELRAHPDGDSVTAAVHIAARLRDADRLEEAIAVLTPHSERHSWPSLGRATLLIRLGRVDEAIAIALARRNAEPA